MRAAVARSLAGDKEGIAALRTRFGEVMKASAYAGAFDFLTSPTDHPDAAFRDLPKLIANLDGIENLKGSPSEKATAAADVAPPAPGEAAKPVAQAE
jgi:hypothetical protein